MMNLRTTFPVTPSDRKINYGTPVIFAGSCFASEIGEKMASAGMQVLINPSGTLFNPASVASAIDIIVEKKSFTSEDLFLHDGLYHSFYHYTDFSSHDSVKALEKINLSVSKAHGFLRKAEFLFITFGTARIFRLKETGMIVSNCHKLPASMFTTRLLTVEEIHELWVDLLGRLAGFNKNLKVIFTLSPIRYLNNGVHDNQISKAILLLSIEKLLEHPSSPGYFPVYELLMDDLRDYRFYAGDMVHPSETAIEYIFDAFTSAFFSRETLQIYKEAVEIEKAMNHRFISPVAEQVRRFADTMLRKISLLEKRVPGIDLGAQKKYFYSLKGDSFS